ncbi:dihydrodipicolinate synthase family protein [uncultured Enterovirga sp.]|uniref:dihydrodipicolinate synthase family protein n=1 Tax=uncultured Enterovirga sp. TaxID=2026352 RepID=UPI0035CC330C
MLRLTGLSAFPITPMDEAGAVDTVALRQLVAPLVAAGVDSIGLLGSTGSYAYLTRQERRLVLDAALDEAGGRVPVLVGIGALRTDEAVRLAQDAKAAGATAGLLAPVSYIPLLDEEVFSHFETVARESGLPLCIYDNPATTHFTFSPSLVGRLSRVAGIVAVKAPGGSEPGLRIAALRAEVDPGFSVGISGDWTATEGLLAGADAFYSVLGGTLPEICLKLVRAAQAGDAEEARRIHAGLEPVWALFRELTSYRVVHAIAELRGMRAMPPRPVRPLGEAARQRVADMLRDLPAEFTR